MIDSRFSKNSLRRRAAARGSIQMFGATLLCSAAMPALGFAQTAVASAAPPQVSEVIVTANKRSEKLSNVAASVDAITSTKIEALGITSVSDYVGLVPNLTQISLGSSTNSSIVIRGVYTGTSSLSSTTAYYLDESALTASGTDSVATYIAPDADLADVDHIEVLKGPQSTLYGANALGGVLRIVTKKPDSTSFFGNVSAGFSSIDGGGTGYSVRGSVNLPIVEDELAMSVNAFHRSDPGYYNNVGTGAKNVNSSDVNGARVALRATPTDRLTIDFDALYQQTRFKSLGFEYDKQDTLTPAFGSYDYSATKNLPSTTHYTTVGTTASYRTDIGTATAAIGYANYGTTLNSDDTALFGPFLSYFTLYNPPGGTLPAADASAYETARVTSEKTTAELRFASKRLGPFEFLVGGFYTNESDFFHTYVPVVNPNGSAPSAFGGILLDSPNYISYQEEAGFGDLTYYILDNLDITGGFRYSANQQNINSQTYGLYSLFFPTAIYKFNDDAENYLLTLRWRPNTTTNFYLRAASGYRPGGPNIGDAAYGPFQADTLWNYEGGVKGSLLNRRLSYSLAVYDIEWKNVQLPGTDATSGSQITLNGGSARIRGVEAEATATPIRGLSLTGAVGYNDAKLESVSPTVTATLGARPGDPLPLTPKWTASLTGDYTRPINSTVDSVLGFTLRYAGDRNSSYPNSVADGNVKLPDYTTLDMRAGLIYEKNYKLMFRIENIGNSHAVGTYTEDRLFVGQPGVYANAIRIRPLTFFVTASVDF